MTPCFGSRLKQKRGLYPWNLVPIRRASVNHPTHLNFQSIDEKWQRRWAETTRGFDTENPQQKFFIVPMFPYPSGSLHMGHLRVYTISDVLARANRMLGRNVLHPIAWDAFGLPAENAAIERGVDPAEWTEQNIKQMKEQLQAMNVSFDWSREFATCDPGYYKHTQGLFLKMYQRGLVYQAESLVNYDPVDRTVLANEQVDPNGFSWRSGAKVEKRILKQWFLKITSFKSSLLNSLDLHAHGQWPDRVISMQRNWLGKSIKVKINFPVSIRRQDSHVDVTQQVTNPFRIVVETERADLLHGVQFLALSAHHPLVVELARENAELKLFLESLPSLPADSDAGFQLPRIYAKNPIARLPDPPLHVCQDIPVYVAKYVTNGDEKVAAMGVPGHDVRDWAFWNEHHHGEKLRKIVTPHDLIGPPTDEKHPELRPGSLNSLCGDFTGLSLPTARARIVQKLRHGTVPGQPKLANLTEKWKLHDWLISRQRYWGTPIPVIHCGNCGPLPVPARQLPVKLPKLPGDRFKGKSGNPLEDAHDWVNVTCHNCGGPAKRETDTMDTFMDSSWYFMRYIDPANRLMPFSPGVANKWLPVDVYVGGVEHAILHLLYARFICKVIASNGLWPGGKGKEAEPFKKLITQGMVHGKTLSDPKSGRFLKPEEVDLSDPSTPKIASSGEVAKVSWEKMSKSKHNGVDPVECIKKYGADVTRAHILFQAPVTEVLEWDEGKIVGIQRWFGRIWRLTQDVEQQLRPKAPADLPDGPKLSQHGINEGAEERFPYVMLPLSSLTDAEVDTWTQVQDSITSIQNSLTITFALNTVISDLMGLTNILVSTADTVRPAVNYSGLSALLRMLAPIAPAFAEECWKTLHTSLPKMRRRRGSALAPSVLTARFPVNDESMKHVPRPRQKCVVQENGKKRLVLQIPEVPKELLQDDKQKDLEKWIMKEIGDTEAGGEWFARARQEQKSWERIVVAHRGALVNLVSKRSEIMVTEGSEV